MARPISENPVFKISPVQPLFKQKEKKSNKRSLKKGFLLLGKAISRLS